MIEMRRPARQRRRVSGFGPPRPTRIQVRIRYIMSTSLPQTLMIYLWSNSKESRLDSSPSSKRFSRKSRSGGNFVAALTGYFDASGAPDQGTVLVVAGFISFESRWSEFEKRWNLALNDAGLTGFHMNELINRNAEFAGWKPGTRRRFLHKLTQIVSDTAVQNFGCIVVLDDWRKVNDDYKLAENDFQPYALAGWSCADQVLDWCKEHIYPAPILVFEHGDKHQRNLLRKVETECGIIAQIGRAHV